MVFVLVWQKLLLGEATTKLKAKPTIRKLNFIVVTS
jgi:hypothetical protein